jgi:heme-degrading monooxygenase HmoA
VGRRQTTVYASVAVFRVRPGKTEEAVRIYLSSVLPAIRKQQGFQGVLALTNHEIDEGYAITLWDTEDDAEAYESSGTYREQIAKFGSTLAEPPTRKIYEVSVQM